MLGEVQAWRRAHRELSHREDCLLIMRNSEGEFVLCGTEHHLDRRELAGSLGLGPNGNLNPEREYPSMSEPIHGSAPDIAGRGIANPIGAILPGVLMVGHPGEKEIARAVSEAAGAALADSVLPPDLGGNVTTREIADAVAERPDPGRRGLAYAANR